MCEYQVLRIWASGPIKRSMEAQQLKSLVAAGSYRPDPAQIAEAMLQRRGVRELLTGELSADVRITALRDGRAHVPAEARPRAA